MTDLILLIGPVITVFVLIVAIINYCDTRKERNTRNKQAIDSRYSELSSHLTILRLYVCDGEGRPLPVLYLFSSEAKLREMGSGQDNKKNELINHAKELLKFLSSPLGFPQETKKNIGNIDSYLVELKKYLSDIVSPVAIPDFFNEEGIKNYITNMCETLSNIELQISTLRNPNKSHSQE